jgi:hypothetical protein
LGAERVFVQNIDLVYLGQPLVSIAFSVGILVFWYFRKHFSRWIILFSLVAYGGAIAIKEVLQFFTAHQIIGLFGYTSLVTALYLGLQTVVFEVGGAYIVARLTVSRWKVDRGDAQAYGLGLPMWENAGLLGVLGLINLVSVYVILSMNSPIAQTVYSSISNAQPALFYPPSQALPLVALGSLERFSSLLIHLAFGWLCLLSAVSGKKRLLLVALPMGLVDAFVPYAGQVPLWVFELGLFVFSLACVLIAWWLSRGEGGAGEEVQPVSSVPSPPVTADGKDFPSQAAKALEMQHERHKS